MSAPHAVIIRRQISEYAARLQDPATAQSPRIKKRILQKLGKLKKALQEVGSHQKGQSECDPYTADSSSRKRTSDDRGLDAQSAKKSKTLGTNLDEVDTDENEGDEDLDGDNSEENVSNRQLENDVVSGKRLMPKKVTKKAQKAASHLLNKDLSTLAVKKQLKKAKKLVAQHLKRYKLLLSMSSWYIVKIQRLCLRLQRDVHGRSYLHKPYQCPRAM